MEYALDEPVRMAICLIHGNRGRSVGVFLRDKTRSILPQIYGLAVIRDY